MRRLKKQRNTSAATRAALMAAIIFGVGAFYCAEIVYANIKDSGAPEVRQFPGWRAHMGSASIGIVAFMICLFLLESLGRGSRRTAVRSVAPWTPLVALTAVATGIHIPTYIVLSIALVYTPWAYLRTCAVR